MMMMMFAAHMARARLRDRHQENLRRKLQLLKQEQGVQPTTAAAGDIKTEDRSATLWHINVGANRTIAQGQIVEAAWATVVTKTIARHKKGRRRLFTRLI